MRIYERGNSLKLCLRHGNCGNDDVGCYYFSGTDSNLRMDEGWLQHFSFEGGSSVLPFPICSRFILAHDHKRSARYTLKKRWAGSIREPHVLTKLNINTKCLSVKIVVAQSIYIYIYRERDLMGSKTNKETKSREVLEF